MSAISNPTVGKIRQKHRFAPFNWCLAVVIIVLSVFALRLTSTVTVQSADAKQNFANELAGPLEYLSIVRARSIVPDTEWLKVEGDPDQAIKQYIEENVGNSVRAQADRLSRDSNLAWIARYGDKEYKHNWKDAYDQNEGALDYTIRAINGQITYSGPLQPNVPFTRTRSILVNPALVPEERRNTYGSEYLYSLTLPNGFSIHFYVPKTIAPNGGSIAAIASDVSKNAIDFCMRIGSIVIILLVLLFPYRYEETFKPLIRLCRAKALFVIILLGGWFALAGSFTAHVSMQNADGNLQALYSSFALNKMQSSICSTISVLVMWGIFYSCVTMITLYIKRIFKIGPRFVQEDSALYWLGCHVRDWIVEGFSASNKRTPEFRLIVVSIVTVILMVLFMGFCAGYFGEFGFVLSALLSLAIIIGMILSIGRTVGKDFHKVFLASQQLADGHFSSVQPEHVGLYQPLYDELLHVSDSYETALKDGLASQVSKAQLISNVSHDLKTPVAGIQSYSELITMSNDMDDIHHYARHLQNYSSRLTALIEDLFDITKATSGDIALDVTQIDLCELMEQVEVEWEDALRENHLETVLSLEGPVMISLDPDKMVRVIDNLFSNIRKYSLPGTRVFVSLVNRGSSCELSFRNTASTILDFDPEQIMERFVRGDSSRHESGSGLGLAIVKSFVEIQGGTFVIQTDGDLFRAILTFPLDPALNVPIAPEAKGEPESSDAPAALDVAGAGAENEPQRERMMDPEDVAITERLDIPFSFSEPEHSEANLTKAEDSVAASDPSDPEQVPDSVRGLPDEGSNDFSMDSIEAIFQNSGNSENTCPAKPQADTAESDSIDPAASLAMNDRLEAGDGWPSEDPLFQASACSVQILQQQMDEASASVSDSSESDECTSHNLSENPTSTDSTGAKRP